MLGKSNYSFMLPKTEVMGGDYEDIFEKEKKNELILYALLDFVARNIVCMTF